MRWRNVERSLFISLNNFNCDNTSSSLAVALPVSSSSIRPAICSFPLPPCVCESPTTSIWYFLCACWCVYVFTKERTKNSEDTHRAAQSLYTLHSPEFLHIHTRSRSILKGNAVKKKKTNEKDSSSKNQFEMSETNAEQRQEEKKRSQRIKTEEFQSTHI